ncbi:MAG: winged helix-turn-helix domain-containing protein [Patescibacteria group bacterium]|nr:winged helix-turn-helix domain-containing protein [Patescibacteria group bacterium]
MKHAPSLRTKALEKRRLEAGRYFAQGKTQVWVARHYSVSRPAVWVWYWSWKKKGNDGLKSKGRSGAPTKLGKNDLNKVEKALLKGPAAHGYATDIWTLERIAKLVKHTTGVAYHPGHVWRILKGFGWTSQKPEARARERDEQKIKTWMREEFPRIQKKGSK